MSGSCRVAAAKAHLPVGTYSCQFLPLDWLALKDLRSFTFFLSLFRRARHSDRFSSLKLVWSLDGDHLPGLCKRVPSNSQQMNKDVCERPFRDLPLSNFIHFEKKFKCHLGDINPFDLTRYSCIYGLTQIVIFNSIAMAVWKWITAYQ